MTTSLVILLAAGSALAAPPRIDDQPGTVTLLRQDWSDPALVTVDADWSGVPGFVGYRGDIVPDLATGTDPQTVLQDLSATPLSVKANQTDPDFFNAGGLAEFEAGAFPGVIALIGSGTGDAPNLVATVRAAGTSELAVSYVAIDIESTGDDAISQLALQYRDAGLGGAYTNVPSGYVADATLGPNLSGQTTPVSATIAAPPAVADVRWITTNATGNDEWIAVDDIAITGTVTGLTVAEETTGAVGTPAANDPEQGALTWAITGGDPGGNFAIDAATGELSCVVATDFETQASYALTVQVTDPEGLSDDAVVTVTVTDVVEVVDSDGDGVPDDQDPCPDDPTDACADTATEGDADADADADSDADADTDTDAVDDTGAPADTDGKAGTGDDTSGCGCDSAPSGSAAVGPGLALLAILARRRTRGGR